MWQSDYLACIAARIRSEFCFMVDKTKEKLSLRECKIIIADCSRFCVKKLLFPSIFRWCRSGIELNSKWIVLGVEWWNIIELFIMQKMIAIVRLAGRNKWFRCDNSQPKQTVILNSSLSVEFIRKQIPIWKARWRCKRFILTHAHVQVHAHRVEYICFVFIHSANVLFRRIFSWLQHFGW